MNKQRQKNIVLLVILLFLVGMTAFTYWYNPYSRQSSTSFNQDAFAIENAAQNINQIRLINEGDTNVLSKDGQQWAVNNQYKLDASMQQVFLALLNKINIKRPVENGEAIIQNVQDTGVQVLIKGQNDLLQSYQVGGDFKSMTSYFVKNNQAYIVEIPGYKSYVAGIFEVPENDWRDRVIFDGIWQDMVQLSIKRPEQNIIRFNYKDRLMRTNSIVADTAEVMNFVERFNYFFVDQYLPDDHIALQKKDEFEPAGEIEIKALDESKNLSLIFYKNPEFNAYLVNINNQEWAAIRNERMEKLWIELEQLTNSAD